MRRIHPLAIVLVVALSALVAAGCGASEKQDYIKEFNAIQEEVAPEINSAATDEKALDKSIKAIDSAITKLEKLDVPKDYKKPHGEVIESLEELKSQYEELKTVEDPTKLAALVTRATASQKKYNDAINKMNEDRL